MYIAALTSSGIGGTSFGKKISDRQVSAGAQICSAGLQPLQAVWPLTRLHAQVWHVPYLLPRECAQGADSRRYQVELVASTVEQAVYLFQPLTDAGVQGGAS